MEISSGQDRSDHCKCHPYDLVDPNDHKVRTGSGSAYSGHCTFMLCDRNDSPGVICAQYTEEGSSGKRKVGGTQKMIFSETGYKKP